MMTKEEIIAYIEKELVNWFAEDEILDYSIIQNKVALTINYPELARRICDLRIKLWMEKENL